MPKYTYDGNQTVVFTHYLDVSDPEHVTTLTAEPGKTYAIRQTEGNTQVQADGQFTDVDLPMPPDGDWSETSDPTWAEVRARETGEELPFDPSEHDVPAVLDHLNGADDAEISRVLTAEAAGKARKGVLDAGQQILDNKMKEQEPADG